MKSNYRLLLFLWGGWLLFVNVSDTPVQTEFRFDAGAYGLAARRFTARKVNDNSAGVVEKWPRIHNQSVVLAPRQAQSWELKW